jgi:hypothetical protein
LDKAIATNDGVIITVTVLFLYFFVNSVLKTSDKKATNGNCHAMLKVIQDGVMIAKF